MLSSSLFAVSELSGRTFSLRSARNCCWSALYTLQKVCPMLLTRRFLLSAHQQRVSFDTFANPDVTMWSYSFRSDHKDYDYSSTGRTFLVGTDENDYSNYALEWLLDEMVDDSDMVICLRVVSKEPKSISPQEEKRYKGEAEKLLKHLQSNAGERKIALILEYAAGKVQDNIMRMVLSFYIH